MRLSKLVLVLPILMFYSCVSQDPSSLVFTEGKNANPGGGTSGDGRTPASTMSDGKKLWTRNCATCHTNPTSNLPTKLYASEEDIDTAIVKEKSMSHLKSLNNDEIALISDYLNKEAIIAAQNTKNNQKVTSKSILSTRSYVASKLLSIFISTAGNTSDDTKIKAIVAFVNNYPGSFGGTCVYNHETCTGESSENYLAEMNASANVIRSGAMVKVCREIHNNTNAINYALIYSGLTSADDATDANIQKLIDAYVPGHDDPNGTILKELKSTHAQAISKSMSKKDAWNMTSYALCSSPVFEKL